MTSTFFPATLAAVALSAFLAAGTGAQAQMGPNGPPPALSGSTGNMSNDVQTDLGGRRGRGQNELELVQTSLLNELSAAGFVSIGDLRKTGETYTASVEDSYGNWQTVQIDPHNRSITPVR